MPQTPSLSPVISPYQPGAIGRVVELHGLYYSSNWNFSLFFEAKVARELADLLAGDGSERNRFWVASLGDCIAGGIAIDMNQGSSREARLRFFIVDPKFQGLGIGDMLMDAAVSFCRQSHATNLFLTTFKGLDAARHLYEKWGFSLTHEQEEKTWGTVVTEQRFDRAL